jgi:hypothetical protein
MNRDELVGACRWNRRNIATARFVAYPRVSTSGRRAGQSYGHGLVGQGFVAVAICAEERNAIVPSCPT